MPDKRISPRARVLKSGFLSLSDKAPKLACTVCSLSDTGAALRVSTTFGLPQYFDLIVDGMRRRCHTQWRTENKIGVAFEST